MDLSPGPQCSPISLPDGVVVRSDPELDPRFSVRCQTSKRETALSDLTQMGRRDARVLSINGPGAYAASSHRQEEEINHPLRQALARRYVKRKIFMYMDRGDKKKEIERRTGLSHQCIRWYRWLWRDEGGHPQQRSKKTSKRSSQVSQISQSQGTRSERSSRKRSTCDGECDSSSADESGSNAKRRRKHCAVKGLKGRSLRPETEMLESGEPKCAAVKAISSGYCADKENVPRGNETMVMSGEMKVLPIRELRPWRSGASNDTAGQSGRQRTRG